MRGVSAVRIELLYANMYKVDLSGSDLQSADLTTANLEYANLRETNLRQAYFHRARVAYANFTGAAFWDTALAGMIGVEEVQVEWIVVGKEDAPQRLEGEQAREWLLAEAAKPIPEWFTKTSALD